MYDPCVFRHLKTIHRPHIHIVAVTCLGDSTYLISKSLHTGDERGRQMLTTLILTNQPSMHLCLAHYVAYALKKNAKKAGELR